MLTVGDSYTSQQLLDIITEEDTSRFDLLSYGDRLNSRVTFARLLDHKDILSYNMIVVANFDSILAYTVLSVDCNTYNLTMEDIDKQYTKFP